MAIFQLLQCQQELRKFRTVPPEQTADVEDCGMALTGMPLWREPPAAMSTGMVQAGLEHSPERQRDYLDLKGAQEGLLGPGAAFLRAATLHVVVEASLLAKTRRPDRHDLRGRQVQSRRDQKPWLRVAGHLDDEDVYGDLRPPHRPYES